MKRREGEGQEGIDLRVNASHFRSLVEKYVAGMYREMISLLIAYLHTEKCFRNLVKSTRIQIVFTIFRFIWNQPDVHLVPNQSRKMVNTI